MMMLCVFCLCFYCPKTTGIGAGKAANIKNCELCARKIAEVADTPKVVVEKSTVPVRTAEAVRRVLATNDKGVPFQVGFSIESRRFVFLSIAWIRTKPNVAAAMAYSNTFGHMNSLSIYIHTFGPML